MKAFFEHFTSAAVAFSGGADSTCVLMLACEFLGADNVTAYTCSDSHIFRYEIENAAMLCEMLGVRHVMFSADLPQEFFTDKINRCYHCKKAILNKISALTDADVILDGTNADDNPDDRPGFKALTESGVRSPLRELGFGKDYVLKTVAALNVEFHDESCKASRLSGEITDDKMYLTEYAEDSLRDRYKGIRYRHDDRRVQFKKPITLHEDDFLFIKETIKDALSQ